MFRGGGRIFGPRPRAYEQKLNKNVKRLARKSALSLKSQGQALHIIEDFQFDSPRTKSFVGLLESLGIQDKKSLFVLADANKNVYLSSRNLEQSKVVTTSDLNTYNIMNASNIVVSEAAVALIEESLTK